MKALNVEEPVQEEIQVLSGVTVVKCAWPDDNLNAELQKLVLEREVDSPGIQTTNAGGWHSRKNFGKWGTDCEATLIKRIRSAGAIMLRRSHLDQAIASEELVIEAWANVNRHGNHNKYHHHLRNDNIWSGVYYVTMGCDFRAGEAIAPIVFVDAHQPRTPGLTPETNGLYIYPTPGMILIFPSSLWHFVPPHVGSGARITIAFNLKHPTISTLFYQALADPTLTRV